jgi:hypothetical protein
MADFELNTSDLKRITKLLAKVADGKELKRGLTTRFRNILRPIRAEAKASLAGGHHLRPLLKRAVKMQVKTSGKQVGARVIVSGKRMPDRMKKLPQYYEGFAPRWRHPVFGNKDVWVDQGPRPRGRFKQITAGHEAEAKRQVEAALEDVLRKL